MDSVHVDYAEIDSAPILFVVSVVTAAVSEKDAYDVKETPRSEAVRGASAIWCTSQVRAYLREAHLQQKLSALVVCYARLRDTGVRIRYAPNRGCARRLACTTRTHHDRGLAPEMAGNGVPHNKCERRSVVWAS